MSVKVLARIRPLLKSELDKDIIVTPHCSASPASSPSSRTSTYPSVIHIPNPKNEAENYSFTFNRVFESHTSQKELFEAEIKPTVKHLFNGYDVTLFAYGVTGTGKTYTMRGGKGLEDRGIIPRLLSAVYRKARTMQEKSGSASTKVDVSMSYYEIYNDKVYDLFEASEKRTAAGLPLRDNGAGRTMVVGLTERPCGDLKTFEKLYDRANANRRTSATKLNAHSSRSHAVLCVKLAVTEGERTLVSTASCIDLAGSEDNRRTENNRERLVESSAINKSLFVLGQCVEAISKGQSRIPYRESKMTRILSLGQNNGLCICLLNLCPIRSFHLDTLSSLNFANRTKKIEVREVENEPVFEGYQARPAGSMATVQRQPLKSLSHTAHNATVKRKSGDNVADASAPAKPALKPMKTFTVFSDKSRLVGRRSSGGKRTSPGKRLSGGIPVPRAKALTTRSPTKRTPTSAVSHTFSQDTIEDLVEKKVREMLASKALEAPVTTQPEISAEVQKRLEMLEQKIEAKGGADEDRAEGLSFLLMAKQHMARGEEGSALKMYELAKGHFPDNVKLEARIAKLRDKAKTAKKCAYLGKENVPPAERGADASGWNDDAGLDRDEPHPGSCADARDDTNRDEHPVSRPPMPGRRQRKTKVLVVPFEDAVGCDPSEALPTPRARKLLDIINTRDAQQIRALKGVGAKKAESIVEALGDKENMASLQALAGLKGVGLKTVENMRVGLAACI